MNHFLRLRRERGVTKGLKKFENSVENSKARISKGEKKKKERKEGKNQQGKMQKALP
jgi:hypothetical protein